MMATRRLLATLPFLLLVLVGCGGDGQASLDPPAVRYNEDLSEMGMFVVDPRYTVAALPVEERWILFDDIGEFFRYHIVRFPEREFRVTWVNDYNDREWLRAEEAWFVQTATINTPMGWGVAAFREEDAARRFHGEQGGEIFTWDEAALRDWNAPPPPHGH